jgi:cellulose synthase (UDP-forming)
LQFDPQSIDEQRAIIALVYGDSDLHMNNQRARQRRIGLTEGFIFLLRVAFRRSSENFRFLSRLAWQRLSAMVLSGWGRVSQRFFEI